MLEEKWRDIRDEVERMFRYRDSIPRFQDVSRNQYKISPDDKWETFVLYGFGFKSELNCSLFRRRWSRADGSAGFNRSFLFGAFQARSPEGRGGRRRPRAAPPPSAAAGA
jgi:aspartyl/asparaginyl beta-hydroxylase